MSVLDEVIKVYGNIDSKSMSMSQRVRLDVSKVLKQVQCNLTPPIGSSLSGDVITRCFKLVDILFDGWGESFMEDASALYPIVIVRII